MKWEPGQAVAAAVEEAEGAELITLPRKKRKCRLKDVFLFTLDDAGNINFIKNGDIK